MHEIVLLGGPREVLEMLDLWAGVVVEALLVLRRVDGQIWMPILRLSRVLVKSINRKSHLRAQVSTSSSLRCSGWLVDCRGGARILTSQIMLC